MIIGKQQEVKNMLTYNIIVVGDGCTGKTTFINRHISGEYNQKYIPTFGRDVKELIQFTSRGKIQLIMHDIAGQEQYGGLRDAYYFDAQGCLIFFDTTSIVTYKNSQQWYKDVTGVVQDIPIILVGNKKDLKVENQKAVKIWQEEKNIPYLEISSKSLYNYELPLLLLCRMLTGDNNLIFTMSDEIIKKAEIIKQPTPKEVLTQQVQINMPDEIVEKAETIKLATPKNVLEQQVQANKQFPSEQFERLQTIFLTLNEMQQEQVIKFAESIAKPKSNEIVKEKLSDTVEVEQK